MVGVGGELGELSARLAAGEPLTAADRDALVATRDLLAIGMLADDVRRRLHGNRVTFVRVARVPLRRPATGDGGVPAAAGEVWIDGQIENLADAESRVREIVGLVGSRPVSGFALSGLVRSALAIGVEPPELFRRLRASGLALIAEADVDRFAPERPGRFGFGGACEAAVTAGLDIARVTIHNQPEAGIVPLIEDVRSVQSALGTLRAFAPLPRSFQPDSPTTGYDDVKQVALARILLANVPTIQVDWGLYGPKLAQVALTFGADDIDGVPAVEDPTTTGWRRSSIEDVRRNVTSASLVPAERNGRFAPLT